MKKMKYMPLIVLGVAIIAVSAGVLINFGSISAAVRSLKFSEQELKGQMSHNVSSLLSSAEALMEPVTGTDGESTPPTPPLRDFTDEEEEMLRNGTISPEEVVERIFAAPDFSTTEETTTTAEISTTVETTAPETTSAARTTPPETTSAARTTPPETTTPARTTPPETTRAPAVTVYLPPETDEPNAATPKSPEMIKESVKQLLTVKAQFTAKLGEVEKKVISDYSALPDSEKNLSGKGKVIMDNLGTVSELEKQCDATVEDIVTTLESYLIENGYDTSICDMIRDYYSEEKELKKAYYLKKALE